VDLLNKILFLYEKAQNYGLEDIEEIEIIEKTTNKKVYFFVEGQTIDSSFREYIEGEQEAIVVNEIKQRKAESRQAKMDITNMDDSDESEETSSEDLDENYMIDYESKVIQSYQIPYEPKLYPLYVCNR